MERITKLLEAAGFIPDDGARPNHRERRTRLKLGEFRASIDDEFIYLWKHRAHQKGQSRTRFKRTAADFDRMARMLLKTSKESGVNHAAILELTGGIVPAFVERKPVAISLIKI